MCTMLQIILFKYNLLTFCSRTVCIYLSARLSVNKYFVFSTVCICASNHFDACSHKLQFYSLFSCRFVQILDRILVVAFVCCVPVTPCTCIHNMRILIINLSCSKRLCQLYFFTELCLFAIDYC